MLVSTEAAPSTLRIVPCYLAGSRYSFDIADITALVESALVRKSDGEGPVCGWIERRGQRVPVYSLAERLGVTRESKLGEVAVVLKRGPEPIAVSVDGVSQPLDVATSHIHAMPPAATDPSLRNLIASVLWHKDALWLHMDAARVAGAGDAGRTPGSTSSKAKAGAAAAAAGSGAILAFAIPSINPSDRELLFAVSARQVLEILEDSSPVPVPAAPSHLRGLIAWRKRPVPFVDLGRILGWAPNPREKTAVLVVRGARVAEVLALPIAAGAGTFRLPFPHSGSNEPCQAVPAGVSSVMVEVDRTSVCVLDIDSLLRPA